MELISAMKEVKYTLRKLEDLRKKIATYCADLDCMAPTYGSAEEQTKKISEWLQSHHDLALNLTDLKRRIQATNLATNVAIKVGEVEIIRTIAEWIIRRREIIDLEIAAYSNLTDRELASKSLLLPRSAEADKFKNARVRFYFNATLRDEKLDLLKNEKEAIDKTLEVTNATTQLLD